MQARKLDDAAGGDVGAMCTIDGAFDARPTARGRHLSFQEALINLNRKLSGLNRQDVGYVDAHDHNCVFGRN